MQVTITTCTFAFEGLYHVAEVFVGLCLSNFGGKAGFVGVFLRHVCSLPIRYSSYALLSVHQVPSVQEEIQFETTVSMRLRASVQLWLPTQLVRIGFVIACYRWSSVHRVSPGFRGETTGLPTIECLQRRA
jgi:hypothetical protein